MNYITEKEVWKPIAVEGLESYKISNLGNIVNPKGRVRKSYNNNGYRKIDFQVKKKKHRYLVHRLVAITFLKNDVSERKYINHINGIKDDNRVVNLEWCTPSENIQHAVKTGLIKTGLRKYREIRFSRHSQYDELCNGDFINVVYERFKNGEKITDLAKEYKIDRRNLGEYLRDNYGDKEMSNIFNSKAHNGVPDETVDEAYSLLQKGYTIIYAAKILDIKSSQLSHRLYKVYGTLKINETLDLSEM